MITMHKDSYYEEYKRHKEKRPANLQSSRLMTDRAAYISFLEVQLERVSAACLTVQGYSDRMEQMQAQINTLEEKVHNVTRLSTLTQTLADRRVEESRLREEGIERRLHSLESLLRFGSGDRPMWGGYPADVPPPTSPHHGGLPPTAGQSTFMPTPAFRPVDPSQVHTAPPPLPTAPSSVPHTQSYYQNYHHQSAAAEMNPSQVTAMRNKAAVISNEQEEKEEEEDEDKPVDHHHRHRHHHHHSNVSPEMQTKQQQAAHQTTASPSSQHKGPRSQSSKTQQLSSTAHHHHRHRKSEDDEHVDQTHTTKHKKKQTHSANLRTHSHMHSRSISSDSDQHKHSRARTSTEEKDEPKPCSCVTMADLEAQITQLIDKKLSELSLIDWEHRVVAHVRAQFDELFHGPLSDILQRQDTLESKVLATVENRLGGYTEVYAAEPDCGV